MNTRILRDEEINELIVKYEKKMLKKNLNVEEVIVLDKCGNIILHEYGMKDEVELSPYQSEIQNARVLLHTHPSPQCLGGGLSPSDVASLSYYCLDEIRACDKRFWYSAKKTENSKQILPNEYDKMYYKMNGKLYNRYKRLGKRYNDIPKGMFELSSLISNKLLNEYGYEFTSGEW